MITKDQALVYLARAYLDSKVQWRIYLETIGDCVETRVTMIKAETKYETLAQAYVDCGVVTWNDIHNSWFYNTKIVVPSEA